ncbi:hypothetical protein V6N13_038533 [Hibiscus sabdariffa]|uniref:Uncharacterized protein n=1 Tax=Hibiscus sabdariffa TaxID=183260 RepID=A0ABR2S1P8_9ROSI
MRSEEEEEEEEEALIVVIAIDTVEGNGKKGGLEELVFPLVLVIFVGFVFTFAVKILCGQVVLSSLKANALLGLAVGLNRH